MHARMHAANLGVAISSSSNFWPRFGFCASYPGTEMTSFKIPNPSNLQFCSHSLGDCGVEGFEGVSTYAYTKGPRAGSAYDGSYYRISYSNLGNFRISSLRIPSNSIHMYTWYYGYIRIWRGVPTSGFRIQEVVLLAGFKKKHRHRHLSDIYQGKNIDTTSGTQALGSGEHMQCSRSQKVSNPVRPIQESTLIIINALHSTRVLNSLCLEYLDIPTRFSFNVLC
ncbi:hypothetical protein ABKN59_005153 [Abortiporus biennis]